MHSKDPEVRRPYKCNKCTYRATTEAGLRRHAVIHSEETPYACSRAYCEFRTKHKGYVREHEKYAHALVKQVKCTFTGCAFKTTMRRYLEKHILNRHNVQRERKVECPLCCQKFLTFSRMQSHLKTHTIERPWRCSLCSFEAKARATVRLHCESLHGKISVTNRQALHQCNLCKFKTVFPEELKYHLALHSDERPYSCCYPGCSYRAKLENEAHKHEKLVHFPDRHPCAQPGCNHVAKLKT